MLHDRDEKYEGSDEPEYHFSEEEGGDYVDTELPKEPAPAPSASKIGGANALTPSKRMLISLVVFLVLVFVVYKMVAPTTQAPSTDIAAVPAATQTAVTQMPKSPPSAANKAQVPEQVVATTSSAPGSNTSNVIPVSANPPVQTTAQASMSPSMATPTTAPTPVTSAPPTNMIQPAAPSSTPVNAPAAASPAGPPVTSAMSSAPPTMPMATTVPAQGQPMPIGQQTASPQQQGMLSQGVSGPQTMPPPRTMPPQQAMQQSAMPSPSQTPQATVIQQPVPTVVQQQAMPPVTEMPSVIQVQSPPPPAYGSNQPTSNDAKIAALEADSTKMMNQLQSDYVQKLNDFSSQNKALQEQVQTLNSRMSTMESQINQLVQALTRQNQGADRDTIGPVEQPSTQQHISFNVQAIIPGRAWLRSDNGETLTVAEGDVIKSLGRVTKIDPYDGVVEINTGNKVVSLSYGTGA